MRSISLRAPIVICVLALTAPAVSAQSDYPTKPVRLVHGFTPGGISDVLARALGAKLGDSMGQQVLVDPRPGAGTTIASDHIAKSAADGYTLFLQDMTTHAINASLYRRLPYDSVRDFTPVTLIAASPLILVVHPSLPVKSVKDLIALAKRRPDEISHGSSGNGTIVHLAADAEIDGRHPHGTRPLQGQPAGRCRSPQRGSRGFLRHPAAGVAHGGGGQAACARCHHAAAERCGA